MEVKPLAGLTRTLRVLLKISIAITATAVVTGFYNYYSYANIPPGVDPNETLLPSDVVNSIVGLIQVVLAIILGITFLRWIYRTNKNLRTLSGEQMTFTPGWSVGWYFVPIANLFKPYQAMKEIWHISHKNESTTYSLVGWWWCLWIVSNFPVDSYIASTMAFIVSDGLNVILNIVALMLVTRIGMAYSKNIVEPTGVAHGDSADAPLSPTEIVRSGEF
ncbi:MAG: DUF4328 domain-containing protein [Planctomycetes bacterium]|nr:DUF4328 domain-containing protein [Planctomycetota bacterium]